MTEDPIVIRRAQAILALILLIIALPVAAVAVHWNGPAVLFARPPQFVDILIAGEVEFNRALSGAGLFNSAVESGYNATNGSPSGTQWAASGLNGNPVFVFGAGANLGNGLLFGDWRSAYGGQAELATNILNRPAVVKIAGSVPTEDIYLDIQFSAWGQTPSAAGSFTYLRSTPAAMPMPDPVAVPVLSWPGLVIAMSACGFLAHRRLRRILHQ